MRIAVVEDEQYFLTYLLSILQEWKIQESIHDLQISPFSRGEDIIEEYRHRCIDYDVIFMDIKLGQIDGLETSRRMRTLGYCGAIVFTTNHREYEYARQGYDVKALNYLAKPIQLEHITACMERLKQNTLFRFCHKGVRWSIPYKEILFFESFRSYIKTHTLNKGIGAALFKSNTQELLRLLPKVFIQNHRSFVVNMTHIIRIQGNNLYLSNNESITIGKNYMDVVLNAFHEF